MTKRNVAERSARATTPTDVLDFWFGPMRDGFCIEDRGALWFRSTPEDDANIRARFESLVLSAAAGRLDHWASTPSGRLALISLLDQFPRNMYRGTARAFELDAQAHALAEDGVAAGDDRALPLEQRAFFYLPFEHQESMEIQERSVELYERLRDETPKGFRDRTGNYLRFAQQHRDVIRRFGRFPHRNAMLGRTSTEDEERYLSDGGGFR
jgi:uncharacterized protein (DUF924 family)